ncbi:MAG: hypothetical protein R2836_07295 [Chitinophagales bacterium]
MCIAIGRSANNGSKRHTANSSSNTPICYGDAIELTADGGYAIYNWYG